MKSTPSSRPSLTSAMSLAVSAGRLTLTPGRLMWRRLPSLPSVRTSHSTLLPFLASTFIWMAPLSMQHHVAHVDVVDEIRVVHVHGMFFLAAFAADGEGEFLAGLEIQRHAEVAGADGRALRVHHDADMKLTLGGRGADVRTTRRTQSCGACDMFRRKMLTPASISAAIISARIGGRAEGGDDFRFSHATDKVAWPRSLSASAGMESRISN